MSPVAAGPRRAGWLVMAVLVLGLLLVGVVDRGGSRTPEERAHALAESLMCPTCRGQSVADSDSPAATGIRNAIETGIADGRTDDEIRDEIVFAYGEDIRLSPRRSGLTGMVWVVPVLVLLAAVAGVTLAFRRWRSQGGGRASDDDQDLVQRALETLHAGPGSTRD